MCNSDIEIIKGDTLPISIIVDEGIELIEEIYFTSSSLGINRKANYIEENIYQLIISSEETQEFKERFATYDITAILKNTHIKTTIYNGYIYIYEKENNLYD